MWRPMYSLRPMCSLRLVLILFLITMICVQIAWRDEYDVLSEPDSMNCDESDIKKLSQKLDNLKTMAETKDANQRTMLQDKIQYNQNMSQNDVASTPNVSLQNDHLFDNQKGTLKNNVIESEAAGGVPDNLTPQYSYNLNETTKVIIYAKYRTGSTFTSEFFFRHRSIAYMFEPLRLSNSPDIVKDGQAILWDMLSCNFHTAQVRRILGWWLQRVVFCQISDQTPGCRHGTTVQLRAAQKHCQSSRHRVVKVIRIENIWELEEFLRQKVKVVHVIRDPRGVTHSRQALHGPKTHFGNVTEGSAEYCRTGVEDIKYIRRQLKINDPLVRSLYHIMRYEDMAADPQRQMEELYNVLGIEPDDNLKNWVQKIALDSQKGHQNNIGYEFGTNRLNPAYTSMAWRKNMRFRNVDIIQSNCREFMEITGYLPVANQRQLQDFSVPLFKAMDLDALFYGNQDTHNLTIL